MIGQQLLRLIGVAPLPVGLTLDQLETGGCSALHEVVQLLVLHRLQPLRQDLLRLQYLNTLFTGQGTGVRKGDDTGWFGQRGKTTRGESGADPLGWAELTRLVVGLELPLAVDGEVSLRRQVIGE